MKAAILAIAVLFVVVVDPASAQIGRWQVIGPSREASGVYLLDTMTGCTWILTLVVDKDRRPVGNRWELLEREGIAPGETALRPLLPKSCLQIEGGVNWKERPSN